MADYTEMWRNLGLNLENHASLLAALGGVREERLWIQSSGFVRAPSGRQEKPI